MAPKIKSPKQVFLVLTPTIPFTAEMGNEIRSPLRASRTTNFPRGGTHVVSTVAVSSVNRRFLSALSHQTRRNPARRKERDGPVGARNQLRELAEREGFEPSKALTPYTLSKRAHSTTLPPVLKCPVGCGRKLTSNTSDSKLFLQRPTISEAYYFTSTAGIPRLWFSPRWLTRNHVFFSSS